MLGQEIGKYRVTSRVGEGGMGAVYLGTHNLIGRQAAIKVLLPELSHNQEIVNRFFNEAKATTAIKHPGIVEIFDFGYHINGSAYIVMEYLEGESLAHRIKSMGRLGHDHALNIIRQIAGALHAAHSQGIVHRDLKPDNVFLISDPEVTGGERIKILDFGIAKLASDGGTSLKTRTGTVMGTPAYMAPEQCRGSGRVDQRADVYALGCMLFEMVCGRLPFVGEGSGEVLAAHIHVPPPQPRGFDPNVAPALEALILRLLAKDPAQRPQSCSELIAEIDALGFSPWRSAEHPSQPWGRAPSHVPVPTPTPTTLSSAATAHDSRHPSAVQPARRGKALPIAIGGALVVAGVVITVIVAAGSSGSKQGASEPSEKAPVSSESKEEAAKAPPSSLLWTIKSVPNRAEIYRKADGVRLGQTPYGYSFAPSSGELVFLVKKKGFEDQILVLSAAEGGERTVELVAMAVSKPEKKAVESPPRSRPRATHRTKKRQKKRTPSKYGDTDAPNPFD